MRTIYTFCGMKSYIWVKMNKIYGSSPFAGLCHSGSIISCFSFVVAQITRQNCKFRNIFIHLYHIILAILHKDTAFSCLSIISFYSTILYIHGTNLHRRFLLCPQAVSSVSITAAIFLFSVFPRCQSPLGITAQTEFCNIVNFL